MAIPNIMSFSPFAILTAEEMNNLIENDQALADGSALNDKIITSRKFSPTTLYMEPANVSPVPTTLSDISGSSTSLTTPVTSYALITVTAHTRIVGGADRDTYIYLNVNGTNHAKNIYSRNQASTDYNVTVSRTWRIALTASTHTIKLQMIASAASTVELNNITMTALIVSQP